MAIRLKADPKNTDAQLMSEGYFLPDAFLPVPYFQFAICA